MYAINISHPKHLPTRAAPASRTPGLLPSSTTASTLFRCGDSLSLHSAAIPALLTPFFDTRQGRWFQWRGGGWFGRNQKMHSAGIGRWSLSDGLEEYASKMLIYQLWFSADGELPMKSRKEKRTRTLRESWWFGCNVYSSLFLVGLFF
jgi:hypothetical protein